MTTYFDSSALVALYVPESLSSRCAELARAAEQFPFTSLHALEVRTSIRMRHGRKALSAHQLQTALNDLEDDLQARRLVATSIDLPAALARAETLSASHAERLLCRSLDVLHVASAVEWSCHRFVSGNDRQLALAAAIGLDAVDVKRNRPRTGRRT